MPQGTEAETMTSTSQTTTPSHDPLAYLGMVEEARTKINEIVANSGKAY